jgi:hypothetical protein
MSSVATTHDASKMPASRVEDVSGQKAALHITRAYDKHNLASSSKYRPSSSSRLPALSEENRLSWLPMVVLPNIHIQCRVEANSIAIVGQQDARVKDLRKDDPAFDTYLERFTDAFGVKHRPSVVILQPEAAASYRMGRAISSFRDLLAMSVIPYKRAQVLKAQHYGTGINPLFSDAFDFYPWMVDRNREYLVLSTPALTALNDVDKFSGQLSPGISASVLDETDEPLLECLIKRWEQRYANDAPSWSDTALFRSLNMANQAARTPFATAGTFYDQGRLVALWVSAFEILAHPGGDKEVGLSQVHAVLAGRHSSAKRNPLERSDRKLRQSIYEKLYRARNDYLHGNPVTDNRLMLPGGQWDLTQYAAPLYRLMLTEFLELHHVLPEIPRTEPGWDKRLGKAIAERLSLEGYQDVAEAALRTFPT